MGSYARFKHYLTTLEVETCPEFWPPSPVSGPLCVTVTVPAEWAAGPLVRVPNARTRARYAQDVGDTSSDAGAPGGGGLHKPGPRPGDPAGHRQQRSAARERRE